VSVVVVVVVVVVAVTCSVFLCRSEMHIYFALVSLLYLE